MEKHEIKAHIDRRSTTVKEKHRRMSRFVLPHFENISVDLCLFSSVKNVAHVKEQLLLGNDAYEYAFIDARNITSILHLLAAIHHALRARERGALKTKNVHSEIVYALSPIANVSK